MGILEDSTERVLGDFARATGQLNLPYLVVGAGARVLLSMEKDFSPGRLTTDWDLAMPCPDWPTFNSLRDSLTSGSAAPFETTGAIHRLRHRATDVLVDLIPFGGIESSPGVLIWPSGEEFDVSGFSAALQEGEELDLKHGTVLVTSFPFQVILKAQAYLQRREQGMTHDVADLVWVLRNYGDGKEKRIFGEAYLAITQHGLEPDAWGALLLGLDLRGMGAELLTALRVVLYELKDEESKACSDALGGGFLLDREAKIQSVQTLAIAASLGLEQAQ
ncbi:MAG: hypothetical protein GY930_12760 [bacterium]|nr:hypothetical protein [bacterium]